MDGTVSQTEFVSPSLDSTGGNQVVNMYRVYECSRVCAQECVRICSGATVAQLKKNHEIQQIPQIQCSQTGT